MISIIKQRTIIETLYPFTDSVPENGVEETFVVGLRLPVAHKLSFSCRIPDDKTQFLVWDEQVASHEFTPVE